MRLRPATAADVPALAALYTQAALALGPQVYGAEQVAAWASFGRDLAAFERYVCDAETWLAEDDSRIALGFCGYSLHAGLAEVHSLYVRADAGRRGLGRRLLEDGLRRALGRGAERFEAWATPFSRALFAHAGMPLAAAVQGEFKGVMFERYRMAGDAAAVRLRLGGGR